MCHLQLCSEFWDPNPRNRPVCGLRPKPPNPLKMRIHYASSMVSTCVTVILDRSINKSSSASAWLGQLSSWVCQHGLLLRMYSCLVSATTVSLPAILVSLSKPHVHPSPLQVYQHGTPLLDLLHGLRPSLCSTPAHQRSQETCCTRTHAMVSL
jgi:hypothetical protein